MSPEQGLPVVQPLDAPPEDEEDDSEEATVAAGIEAEIVADRPMDTDTATVASGTETGDWELALELLTGAT